MRTDERIVNLKLDGPTREAIRARTVEMRELLGVRLSQHDVTKLILLGGLTLPTRAMLPQPTGAPEVKP